MNTSISAQNRQQIHDNELQSNNYSDIFKNFIRIEQNLFWLDLNVNKCSQTDMNGIDVTTISVWLFFSTKNVQTSTDISLLMTASL